MRTLTTQLQQSLETGLYYLSLFTALAIPDIAGALDSDDGQASGERYKVWYETWVRPRFREAVLAEIRLPVGTEINDLVNPLDGETCYRFRCSLLHQGSSQHPKSQYTRILFVEPGATTTIVHYSRFDGALCIDLPRFCTEVVAGTTLWLESVESSARFKNNYDRFARRHPQGLAPYIGGVPVVG